MKKLTFEEFNYRAQRILGSSYVFYPPYKDMKTPVKYKHLVCGTTGTLIPDNIFRGKAKCKYCSMRGRSSRRMITDDEFRKRLHKVRPSDDIILLEPIHGIFKKTKAKCLVCGYGSKGEWTPLPVNLLKGKGCPNCAGNAPKTPDKVINEVKDLGKGEYELLGTKRTKKDGLWLHLLHKECENDYWVRDYSFIHGYRCKFCANKATGDRCRLSLDEVKQRITRVADGRYTYVSGNYNNNQSSIYVRHNVCGTVFKTTWGQLSANRGLCPNCGSSNGEQAIMNYLVSHRISYSYGYLIPDLIDKKNLHFDFWLPQFNTAIEYDGQQHFKPVDLFGGKEHYELQKKHDEMKDNYCNKKGINLIRIKYNESIKDTLDYYLLPLVDKLSDVEFRKVESTDLSELMVRYHYLHRKVTTSYCYGLYYRGSLAGMVTYTRPRISLAQSISPLANKDNTLELSRLYIKDEVSQNLKNITSKFVSWTLRQLKQEQDGNWFIISFADQGMHHTGAIYQATNFLYCGTTKHREYSWNGYGKHGGVWEKGHYYRYMIISPIKYRYIMFLGSKTFKKQARKTLKFEIEPYPKQDSIHYSVGDTEERLIRDRETGKIWKESELVKHLNKN